MKNISIKFLLVLLLVVSLISVGYAAFTIDLNIENISAMFRLQTDIRITNFTLDSKSEDAYSNYEEYNVEEVITEVKIPNNDSYVRYKIDITNLGASKMVISKISGLPDNLTYSLDNYELNHLICDENDKCNLGITKSIYLTIRQKNTLVSSDNTTYNLNLKFEFSELSYNIKYFEFFLPNEYQEIKYIESTGTQRINTKYNPKANTKMELDLSFSGDFDISSGSTGTGTILSSSSSSGNVFSVNFGSSAIQGNTLFTWFDKNQSNGGAVHFLDINDTIRTNRNTMMYENGIFKYGTKSTNVAVKTEDHTSPVYLFGTSGKNFDRYNMKVYRLKFYEDGEIKRDYIPCYRKSDGIVGLYELLTQTFHTNIGTGEFNKGDDVINNSQVQTSYAFVKNIKYDEYGYIDNPSIIRSNYIFNGWTDANGNEYYAGQKVINLLDVHQAEIVLYAQWKTYVGLNIYNVVKEDAKMDSGPSTFVKNSTGINFLDASSSENGKGVYVLSSTVNDENPIYYYRGNVDNNNVVLGDFCWKILRTTDTGGTKLIYNGLRRDDGSCNNTGHDTQIASGVYFNGTGIGVAGAGYGYTDKTSLKLTVKNDSTVTAGTIFAYNIEYDETTGLYNLIGDKYVTPTTSEFTAEKYDKIKEHHYTCFKTTEDGCSTVYYVYMARNSQIFYATLKNGNSIEDLLHIEFEGNSTNKIASTLQSNVNTWYENNMTNYTEYLEDTVFCNDRSLYNPWNLTSPIDNDNDLKLHFDTKARVAYTGKPTTICKYKADSFTVSADNGNGMLPYPVGLITFDEAALAGVGWSVSATDSYLHNGIVWWTMSPGFISATGVYNGVIHTQTDHVAVNYIGSETETNSGLYNGGGVRPSVSLKKGIIIDGGFGTVDNPFILKDIIVTE